MELNIIIHGRSASTLLAEMLLATGAFDLWGDRKFACELKDFKFAQSWRREKIDQALQPFQSKRVLAKQPEFQYFLELLFPYKVRVLVNERSAIEKLRSLMAVSGWVKRVAERYEERGLVRRALLDYLPAGGGVDISKSSYLVTVFFVLAWGNWRVERKLGGYLGECLRLSFDELMLRPHDAYLKLDGFYGFEPRKFWEKWDGLRKRRHQKSGRDVSDEMAFVSPYKIRFEQEHLDVFSEILETFRP